MHNVIYSTFMVLKCMEYRTNLYGPVMIELYKENDVFIEIMGKSKYNFTKFRYVVELDTSNVCVKFQSV